MMRKLDAHHPASVARDPAAPLETQTNDRTQPRQAGRPAAVGVAAGLSGPQVLWALSHIPAVDHGLQPRVLSRTRARGRWSRLHRRAHQHIVAPDPPQLALWG